MTTKIWTISNILSISRIILIIPVVFFFLKTDISYHREMAVLCVLLAMITDALDGYFARHLNEVSELGKIIDPLADKLGVGIIAILLVLSGDIPLWFMGLVLLRDIIIFIGGLYIKSKKGIVLASTLEGKIAVVATTLVLLLAMLHNSLFSFVQEILLWVSVVLLLYSFGVYVKRFFKVFNFTSS